MRLMKSQEFWLRGGFLVGAAVIGTALIEDTCDRASAQNKCGIWHLMYWYGLVLIVTANVSSRPFEFYLGEGVHFLDHARFFLFGHERPTTEQLEEAAQRRFATQTDDEKSRVTFWTLMPSAFISWIFAKSIRNSAWLGGRFGILGGVAYTSWYLSFFSAAFVCYFLRTKYKFKSLPTAVFRNYGTSAVLAFQLAVLWRLFNEVWSNAGVIGSFYGAAGSPEYWGACWLSVLIPVLYVLMGGMRASLFSDVFQAWLAVAFLIVVGAAIGSDSTFSSRTDAFSFVPETLYPATGGWDGGWWTCFLGGVVQGVLSYPFFDPVLTDRAFLASPRTMALSLRCGGFLAMLFILFYAVIGVYGAFYKEHYLAECGCDEAFVKSAAATSLCPADWDPCPLLATTGEASLVSALLGRHTFAMVDTFMALIMITASMSTLDSTFTSAAKLISLEFGGWLKLEGDTREQAGPLRPSDLKHMGGQHISLARVVMVALAFVGTAFLGIEGDVMKATTAAGSCVMGFAGPIWFMIIWKVKTPTQKGWHQAPLAFLVPFVAGMYMGLAYWADGSSADDEPGWTYDWKLGASEQQPDGFYYSRFFGVNLYGHLICLALFLVFFALHQLPFVAKYFPEVELEAEDAPLPGLIGSQLALGKEAPPMDAKLDSKDDAPGKDIKPQEAVPADAPGKDDAPSKDEPAPAEVGTL
jgi:Na+/proline symporter